MDEAKEQEHDTCSSLPPRWCGVAMPMDQQGQAAAFFAWWIGGTPYIALHCLTSLSLP